MNCSTPAFFRRVEQRDRAAIVDALEGQAAARILDRVAFELDRIDDRVRALERVLQRCRLGDLGAHEFDVGQIEAARARLSGFRVSTRTLSPPAAIKRRAIARPMKPEPPARATVFASMN